MSRVSAGSSGRWCSGMVSRSFAVGVVAFLLVSPVPGCVDDELPERGEPIQPGDEAMGEDEGPVCVESCDPVEPDCPPGKACLPTDPGFSCQELQGFGEDGDGSGTRLGLHEACEPGTRTCKEGLVCLQASVPGCTGGTSCCVLFCDTNRPECSDGTTCVPFYEAAWMCDPTVGVCVLP